MSALLFDNDVNSISVSSKVMIKASKIPSLACESNLTDEIYLYPNHITGLTKPVLVGRHGPCMLQADWSLCKIKTGYTAQAFQDNYASNAHAKYI